MAEQETFQLHGDARQKYEAPKVPGLFRSLAELTLRRVCVPEGAHVIPPSRNARALHNETRLKLGTRVCWAMSLIPRQRPPRRALATAR